MRVGDLSHAMNVAGKIAIVEVVEYCTKYFVEQFILDTTYQEPLLYQHSESRTVLRTQKRHSKSRLLITVT